MRFNILFSSIIMLIAVTVSSVALSKNSDDDRNYNYTITRAEFLKKITDIIDLNKTKALEVGPFYDPFLKGKEVRYFDIMDSNGLIQRINDANMDKSLINQVPFIHYVEPNGNMEIIKEKFKVIFSSHNIEHQVDLIKYLNQLSNLLEDNGKVFLIIPDKRYCFDHYINTTPLSQVLAVHWNGEKIHSLETILNNRCEITHNFSDRHWSGDHGVQIFINNKSCYYNALKEFNDAKGRYIDSHKWRFISKSFEFIINSLYDMKLIDLKIDRVFPNNEKSFEFFVILVKA